MGSDDPSEGTEVDLAALILSVESGIVPALIVFRAGWSLVSNNPAMNNGVSWALVALRAEWVTRHQLTQVEEMAWAWCQ